MDEFVREAKVAQFMNDRNMNQSIYHQLLLTFLKKKGGEDTETKAARFIATELLQEAWQEMQRYAADNENNTKTSRTPHV